MFATEYLKPKGGVARVALHTADAVGRLVVEEEGCRVSFADTPLEVPLVEQASHFEETVTADGGSIAVCHRLTMVAERNLASEWLDPDFLRRAALQGVVAEVELCDSRCLLVGYSLRLAEEQPLRLQSMDSSSGVRPNDLPLITLTLSATDAEMAMPIIY